MCDYRMEDIALEIEFLWQLSRISPLYYLELDSMRRLAAMIMRHGGSFSHPMLCEKNRRVDTLYLTACKHMGLLPLKS